MKINGECKYKRKGYSLDLIGERFGRLIVTAKAEDKVDKNSGKHKSQWYCDCDCGTKDKIILGVSLTSGSVRSCGCLHKEVASEIAKTKISHGKNIVNIIYLVNMVLGMTQMEINSFLT